MENHDPGFVGFAVIRLATCRRKLGETERKSKNKAKKVIKSIQCCSLTKMLL